MTIIIGTEAKRVRKPISSRMPPTNSTPDANGAMTAGAGMPQSEKRLIMVGRICSFSQPLQRNTQPTTIRTANGAAQVK